MPPAPLALSLPLPGVFRGKLQIFLDKTICGLQFIPNFPGESSGLVNLRLDQGSGMMIQGQLQPPNPPFPNKTAFQIPLPK